MTLTGEHSHLPACGWVSAKPLKPVEVHSPCLLETQSQTELGGQDEICHTQIAKEQLESTVWEVRAQRWSTQLIGYSSGWRLLWRISTHGGLKQHRFILMWFQMAESEVGLLG